MTALLQFIIRGTVFFKTEQTYVVRVRYVNEFPEACFLGASKRKPTHLHNCTHARAHVHTHRHFLFTMGHVVIECKLMYLC